MHRDTKLLLGAVVLAAVGATLWDEWSPPKPLRLQSVAADPSVPPLPEDKAQVVAGDDPRVTRAMQHARRTVDGFLTKAFPPSEDIKASAVKVAFREGRMREFFWLVDLEKLGDDRYAGSVANRPEFIMSVKPNARIEFKRSDIDDWSYFDKGKMVGNFTACVLLSDRSEPTLKQFQDQTGLTCNQEE